MLQAEIFVLSAAVAANLDSYHHTEDILSAATTAIVYHHGSLEKALEIIRKRDERKHNRPIMWHTVSDYAEFVGRLYNYRMHGYRPCMNDRINYDIYVRECIFGL